MSANSRICIFCGIPRKLTKEHVWPQWLRKHLPLAPGVKRLDFHHNHQGRQQQVRFEPRSGDYGSMKLEVVCKACNGGWMSSLQMEAIPALSELVKGSWLDLSPHWHHLVKWCTMFAMVIEFGNPSSVVTNPATRKDFARTQYPQRSWYVLVGVTDVQPGLTRQAWTRKGYFPRHSAEGVLKEWLAFTTVLTGQFIFQVIGSESEDSLRQIWMREYADLNGFVLLHPIVVDGRPFQYGKASNRSVKEHTLALIEAFEGQPKEN